MNSRAWCFLAIGMALVVAAGGAEGILRPRTRPTCLTGIPVRDYQFRTRSRTALGLSQTAQMVEIKSPNTDAEPALARTEKRIRVYQMETPKLQIDHCSVSGIALQLHANGDWVLNLRADQNPAAPVSAVAAAEVAPTIALREGAQALHIRRNLFSVRIRGYAMYPVAESQPGDTTGKPEVFALPMQEFWVQSGSPLSVRRTGRCDDVSAYHDIVDRVEVEFCYR
jgi:hypothetical protein